VNKNHPSSNSKSVHNSNKDSKLHKVHNPSSRFYRVDNPSSSQQATSVIIPPQKKTQTPKHLQPKLKALSKWYKSPSSKRTTQVLQIGQPKLKPPIVDTSKLQALSKWYKSPSSAQAPKIVQHQLQTPKSTIPSSKLQKYYKSSNSAQAPKIAQHQLQTPNSKTYNAKLQDPKVAQTIKLSSISQNCTSPTPKSKIYSTWSSKQSQWPWNKQRKKLRREETKQTRCGGRRGNRVYDSKH